MRKHYLKHRALARKIITERARFFTGLYKVKLNKVSIKNTKTRWGSCSKLGNLNFSYKLIFLPKELMDYVIIHEVCHLIEFNHSKKFWAQITKTIPGYKLLIKRMRVINITRLGYSQLRPHRRKIVIIK